MKKVFVIVLAALMMAGVLAGCKGNAGSGDVQTVDTMQTVLNTTEYTLYQNIFFNDMKADYMNQQVTKEGTFAVLYDAFSDVTRYYVWGYNDQTKCCDWQWEIKLDGDADIPSAGSFVSVTGEMVEDEAALDKVWIINPQIEVKAAYKGIECDVDMSTMSATLERVEIQNINSKPEMLEGKTVALYGRVNSESSLQHPYYDNTWELKVETEQPLPEFGKMVLVQGTIKDGAVAEATVAETDAY